MSRVQSVIFPKRYWTIHEALNWLDIHEFKTNSIDEKRMTYRFRQVDPGRFDYQRIIHIMGTNNGKKMPIDFVIGFFE